MDNESHDGTHFVRCLKCRKVLHCSRHDTSTLLDHIRNDHPEIEVVENSPASRKSANIQQPTNVDNMNANKNMRADSAEIGNCDENPEIHQVPETINIDDIKCPSCNTDKTDKTENSAQQDDPANDPETNVLFTRHYKVNTPATTPPQSVRTNRKLYRTSIEKWRPAHGAIYCPKCGSHKRPLIKTRSERISDNRCGATCLLGCWPFCFLPFIVPGDSKEYLHCANCKNFLGLYDRENNCIKPNRDFVEQGEKANPPEKI